MSRKLVIPHNALSLLRLVELSITILRLPVRNSLSSSACTTSMHYSMAFLLKNSFLYFHYSFSGSLRISSCKISNKSCVFNSDKTAHVFDGAGSPTQDDIGESDLKPRPPIMATELPLQPLPSSPGKRDEIVVNSPSKKDMKVIDSFNPIMTRNLKVPNNTPEISKSVGLL